MVDKAGQIRYPHFGESMSDIPLNQEILKLLDQVAPLRAIAAVRRPSSRP